MAESVTTNKPSATGGVNPTVAVVGVLVLGVGGYFVLKPYLDKKRDEANLKFEQQQDKSLKGVVIKGKKLDGWYNLSGKKIDSANLATVASDLNGALHPGWYLPTDQDRAVRVFLQTPYGMVKKLEGVYLGMEFGNLKKDLSDKLSDTNWIKIKNYFTGMAYDIPDLTKK